MASVLSSAERAPDASSATDRNTESSSELSRRTFPGQCRSRKYEAKNANKRRANPEPPGNVGASSSPSPSFRARETTLAVKLGTSACLASSSMRWCMALSVELWARGGSCHGNSASSVNCKNVSMA